MVTIHRWNSWLRGLLAMCTLVAWVSFTWWWSDDLGEFVGLAISSVAVLGLLSWYDRRRRALE